MKHIGLVLSGGLGKGAYQVGALAALREYFQPQEFDIVSAASIGALNTYSYLAETLDHVGQIWKTVDFKGTSRSVVSVMRSSFLKEVISSNISKKTLPMPFYVPLLEMKSRELEYCDFSKIPQDKLDKYILASITLPIVNKGIAIDDRLYYDGGVVDNIPVAPVMGKNLDYIICIYFDEMFTFEDADTDKRMIKITFPDNTIISSSVDIKHESILYMIETGYRKTRETLSRVFSQGTENLEAIYGNIAALNAETPAPKTRITMDVVISNLNRMIKRAGHMGRCTRRQTLRPLVKE